MIEAPRRELLEPMTHADEIIGACIGGDTERVAAAIEDAP
jgi:hypothetical protein